MRQFREGGSSVITPANLSWIHIKSAYEHGYHSPKNSLALGQQYAARLADEKEGGLVLVHFPYAALKEKEKFGNIFAVEGIGLRLGSGLRRYVEMVDSPSELPVDEDWVALSGRERAVLAACTYETTEYLEARLASRSTRKGITQLVELLRREASMLAISDGQKVFRMPGGRYFHPENMFSVLALDIEQEFVGEKQRRDSSQHTRPTRRGGLVLV